MKIVFLSAVVAASGCATTESNQAVIQDAVDGDTLDIRYSNGSEERIRLIGVDTPEVYGRNSPSEFGLNSSEKSRNCLEEAAENASDFAASFEGQKVRIVQDSVQDKRGSYGRLLAYLYVDNMSSSINEKLIKRGLARTYITEFSMKNKFLEVERRARSKGKGVWICN